MFNDGESRDLTGDEAKRVFDAYLIINGIVNSKVGIDVEALRKADENGVIEEVVMPGLIYQRDYVSSLDFNNQVRRGIALFEFLEKDAFYSTLVMEYYSINNVSGFLQLFKNLMILFCQTVGDEELDNRSPLVKLEELGEWYNPLYIEKLCINSEIPTYRKDDSFGILRSKFLYKISEYRYFLLNVNFLLDQFYKAQIFSFNSFLKGKNCRKEFLSDKGKNFTEGIYLPAVLNDCFPSFQKKYGDHCVNFANEELCDAYLRQSNKVCLVEFKDVTLNAKVKNSGDWNQLFEELEKKFKANQSGKPKGVTQLINAIKDIEKHSVSFDKSITEGRLEIYPVIIYTDNTFGMEGLNKKYNEYFLGQIKSIDFVNVVVKELTFINLSYFENHTEYYRKDHLNIFDKLDEYSKHTKIVEYSQTSFENFSRAYLRKNIPEDLGNGNLFGEQLKRIMAAE